MAAGRTTVPGSGYSSAYIDALVWGGTVWDPKAGPVTYYFGERPDFKTASTVHGSSPYLARATDAEPWTAEEIGAFKGAISLYAQVCGLTFAPAASAADADIVWWKTDIRDGSLGAAEPPGDSQTWGYFNPSVAESWGNFRAGGDGRNTVIHELGHMTGLAHPHDGGTRDDATLFPGVSSEHDTGSYGLNQGIWTVMSYNSGWDRRDHDLTYGAQGGLGAFDIAALQILYGPNPNTAKGSDVYTLPTGNAPGVGWSCIWDAGGADTISGLRSSKSVTIDLRPATLRPNDPHAGGFVSSQDDVAGGFTIAKDVTIENAVGGSGDDRIWGNAVANKLRGNAGDDVLRGLGGNDRLLGRAGNDILVGGQGEDVFVFDT